ncbi:hypothetical protein [uncultured Tyzzerella sp.]|uniref:hypothetical protein n=1 Tax=uncultured Tyzzerella sp. TaxID=2321398 RepID=UPI002943B34B|nr:hypothetical protein [uncultured Tyzzerella sp.]
MITNDYNSNILNNNYLNTNYKKNLGINDIDNKNLNGQKENCDTCENRKYKDESNDSSVSFKNATKLSPSAASQSVRRHEQEHVNHERAKALRENKEIISQSVTIKTSVCPECGTSYVSGGETVTVTKTKHLDDEDRRGQFIDVYI